MQGKSNWIGVECEGRLFGLLTYFIRYSVGTIPNNIKHLYFTREFLIQENAIPLIFFRPAYNVVRGFRHGLQVLHFKFRQDRTIFT